MNDKEYQYFTVMLPNAHNQRRISIHPLTVFAKSTEAAADELLIYMKPFVKFSLRYLFIINNSFCDMSHIAQNGGFWSSINGIVWLSGWCDGKVSASFLENTPVKFQSIFESNVLKSNFSLNFSVLLMSFIDGVKYS